MDPAALGTLIIGLESIRRDEEGPTARRRRAVVAAAARPRRIRLTLAQELRQLADWLDRPLVGGASG